LKQKEKGEGVQNRFTKMFLVSFLVFVVFNSGVVFSQVSPEAEKTLPFKKEVPSEEFLPGPNFLEKAANFIYIIYDWIRKAIVYLLEKTLFQGNPKLANFYGEVSTFLASLTAVYLLLLLVASARKIIGVILLLGWVLFIIAILARV